MLLLTSLTFALIKTRLILDIYWKGKAFMLLLKVRRHHPEQLSRPNDLPLLPAPIPTPLLFSGIRGILPVYTDLHTRAVPPGACVPRERG